VLFSHFNAAPGIVIPRIVNFTTLSQLAQWCAPIDDFCAPAFRFLALAQFVDLDGVTFDDGDPVLSSVYFPTIRLNQSPGISTPIFFNSKGQWLLFSVPSGIIALQNLVP
jgi:hypothetical protein